MRRPRATAGALVLLLALGCSGPHAAAAATRDGAAPLRIGVVALHGDDRVLSPLVYGGGLLTKSLAYETLVTNDARGRLVPGALAGWTREDGGRAWRLELPPARRFHDGSPLDADAVARHLRRVFADPRHQWTRTARQLARIDVLGPTSLRIVLDEPHAVPGDLAPLNPTGLVAPGAFDGERQVAMIGSGPYRIVGFDGRDRVRYRAADARAGPDAPELVLVDVERQLGAAALDALATGGLDALVDDWTPRIPRGLLDAARALPGVRALVAPGSSVVFLAFNTRAPPFDDLGWRLRVAAAVDRRALVRSQHGYARPAPTLFGATVADWPASGAPPAPPAGPAPRAIALGSGELARRVPLHALPLRLVVYDEDRDQVAAAHALAEQLLALGLVAQVQALPLAELFARRDAGTYELLLTQTWGLPYDPQVTLVARLSPLLAQDTAVEDPPVFTSPELTEALRAALALPDEPAARRDGWRGVQAVLDAQMPIVPLYVPDRVALLRERALGLAFGPNGYTLDLRALR